MPTQSVGTPRQAHFWLPHCILSCRFCSPRFHVEHQFCHECIATSVETFATHGSHRRGSGDDPGPYRILHSRICSALQLTLCRLQEHFGQPAEDLAFQVDHTTRTRGLRIFKGQRRFRGSNTKVLRVQHVMELTEFLLQSAYFKVGLDTYCQIQGACMGSPLAPVFVHW